MIPFLTYPLALIALASIPALAAIYILRNRFRRRQVSSLMLWRFRVQSKEGGARVHRLQLPLLFFLELIALLLLVTAATGPNWKLPQATRPLIVILDDSLSMRATVDGQSARDRARQSLERLFRLQPPPSTRLILAGAEPRLAGGAARTWSEVETSLNEWSCWASAVSIESAITLASEMGRQKANVLVLTDHAPASGTIASDRLEWRGFGRAAGNRAIVNASRSANEDADRCLVEVANFSKEATSTWLDVRTGSNSVQRTSISIGPGEQQRVVFNVPAGAPPLEISISDDSLAEDNAARLLPPVRKRVRVQVSLTNSVLEELVERTLDATGLRAAISTSPELVIHQFDSAPGSNAWSLRWITPAEPVAYTGPFLIDTAHPLAQGLGLDGVVWAAAPATNAQDAVPIIMAGNVPLIAGREDLLGRQFLTLTMDADLSTLSRTPEWPILFYNLLDWRASQIPGLAESNARLGTDVLLRTTGDPVQVVWPDATVKVFAAPGARLALETPMPGIYSVSMAGTTNLFAVNPFAPEESNLTPCATGVWGGWKTDLDQRREQRPMAWLFALGALGLMLAHLWLLVSGKAAG